MVYERFYDALGEVAKAELRSAFFKASQPVLPNTKDEVEHVGHYRFVKAWTQLRSAGFVILFPHLFFGERPSCFNQRCW